MGVLRTVYIFSIDIMDLKLVSLTPAGLEFKHKEYVENLRSVRLHEQCLFRGVVSSHGRANFCFKVLSVGHSFQDGRLS